MCVLCLHRIRKSNARRRGTNLTYESFGESETRPSYTSASTYLIEGVEGNDQAHTEFIKLLSSKGLSDDDIDTAYKLARDSMIYRSAGRGYRFEPLVRNMLLTELDGTPLKVYYQVCINGGSCRIDFVVSPDEYEDKNDIKLDNTVIISTKTSCGTSWREDTHLYDKCKAYVMLTVETQFPTEQLPKNVYFASPHISSNDGQKLSLDGLIHLVKSELLTE